MDNHELKVNSEDMSQLLMQSIVDKLEGMELLLHAALGQKPAIDLSVITREIAAFKREVQEERLKHVPDRNKLDTLNQNLVNLDQRLSALKDIKVEYKHTLHKGIWISATLALLASLLIVGWVNTYSNLSRYRENDIKYRYLKAYGSNRIMQICGQIDSLYKKDPDGFTGNTIAAEQELLRVADSVCLAREKKREAATGTGRK
ncbi:hypothetical protein [Sediminibacterium soli]|uniref:hypothetical protein n=1 Tax=Sediminibacterium soli TaxID=2698829 RepID=UPI001379960D|nr:hypothetical protein [Sediminibacterium soli]NCI45017.1 hypothetical protein [Sediminibacterium soli]